MGCWRIDVDRATPNLPSRNFKKTAQFYSAIGFAQGFRDEGWMILSNGAITLEFFPHPDLNPSASWFSCCLRLDDLDGFYASCKTAGVPEKISGQPRIQPPRNEGDMRIGALIDPDGSLIRLIQN
jgi:hypothetical protein